MKKYFMNLKWIDTQQPVIHLKDHTTNNNEFVIIPNIFEAHKMKSRICGGSINPLTQEYFPCSRLVDLNQTQCYSCTHRFDFYNCIRCCGNICTANDDNVLKYCNTPHYVYLAYFSEDKIKVGTASAIRKYERLLEQGAIFSIFVARTPNGRIARQIEKNIIDGGITGSVTTMFKMKNLAINESIEDIKKRLIDTYQLVSKNVDKVNEEYLIQPEFIFFENIFKRIEKNMLPYETQIDMFGTPLQGTINYEIKRECDEIVGNFLFAVGKTVALEQNGIIHLYDSKKWEGFLFDFNDITTFETYG